MLPPHTFIGTPVLSLQAMLREISFVHPVLPRLIPDGLFGEHTLEAVMVFQREFFPPVTGHVDSGTWNAIVAHYQQAARCLAPPLPCRGYPARAYTIAPGDACVHLYLIQSMFKGLSHLLEEVEGGPVTGVQDEVTTHNTRWLQRMNETTETGVMDKDTWDTLSRLYTIFVSHAQTPWRTRPELFRWADTVRPYSDGSQDTGL